MTQRLDTRGLRQQSSVQLGLPGGESAGGGAVVLSDRLRAAALALTERVDAGEGAWRDGGDVGWADGGEDGDGLEDAGDVLEHWARRTAGKPRPWTAGGAPTGPGADPRFATLLKLSGAAADPGTLGPPALPLRVPEAATGGPSTVRLGGARDPDMYTTSTRSAFGAKQRSGPPGKRNDRSLPQHRDHVREVRREAGDDARGAWLASETAHNSTFRGPGGGAYPKRTPLGTMGKTGSQVVLGAAPGALEGGTSYRDQFRSTVGRAEAPPHLRPGYPHPSDSTVDLRHRGARHAAARAREVKRRMAEQVRQGALSG